MELAHEVQLTHSECKIIKNALYLLMYDNSEDKDFEEVFNLHRSFDQLLKGELG